MMRFLGVGLCLLSALVVCLCCYAAWPADTVIPVADTVDAWVGGSRPHRNDLSDPSPFYRLIDYNSGELGHGYVRCRTVVYVDSTWTRYPTGVADWHTIVPIRMDTLFVQVFERP